LDDGVGGVVERSYLGFHHHCALVTCAHAFLTLERQDRATPFHGFREDDVGVS